MTNSADHSHVMVRARALNHEPFNSQSIFGFILRVCTLGLWSLMGVFETQNLGLQTLRVRT